LTFSLADLVKVADDVFPSHFAGKVGIVTIQLGQDHTMTNESGYRHSFDSGDEREFLYYGIMLANGKTHIFSDRELILKSKAGKTNNENR
jgi:hypothetical protein